MAQSPDLRMVTESKLAASQAKALAPVKTDISALKALGGLTPGDVNDATTANLIGTKGTDTEIALSATIDDAVDPLPVSFAPRSEAILSDGVRRIVPVDLTKPYPPLQDGTLVLEYNAPVTQFFEDFESSAIGSIPASLVAMWTPGLNMSVISDVTGSGKKVLRISGPVTPSTRRALALNMVPADPSRSAIEIFLRWKTNTSAKTVRAIANISGSVGAETSIQGGWNNGTAYSLSTYRGGTQTLSGDPVAGVLPADTYSHVRLRINATTASMRRWEGTIASEPTEWDLTWTNGSIGATGRAGIFTAADLTSLQHIDIDCIGIGIGGTVAPTETV